MSPDEARRSSVEKAAIVTGHRLQSHGQHMCPRFRTAIQRSSPVRRALPSRFARHAQRRDPCRNRSSGRIRQYGHPSGRRNRTSVTGLLSPGRVCRWDGVFDVNAPADRVSVRAASVPIVRDVKHCSPRSRRFCKGRRRRSATPRLVNRAQGGARAAFEAPARNGIHGSSQWVHRTCHYLTP